MQEEIDERREFLKDMEALGQANKYRTIIETEISQVITDNMPLEDGSYYVMPSLCLSICLSVFKLFVSAPCLNPLKDFFETWVKYSPCRDNMQKSFQQCRQRSRSHLEVKVQKITFRVHSTSTKRLKIYS